MKSLYLKEVNWKTLRNELDRVGSVKIEAEKSRMIKIGRTLDTLNKLFGYSEISTFSDKLSVYKLFFKLIGSLLVGGKVYDFMMLFILRKPHYKIEASTSLIFSTVELN